LIEAVREQRNNLKTTECKDKSKQNHLK
jgi:hypothetical protein